MSEVIRCDKCGSIMDMDSNYSQLAYIGCAGNMVRDQWVKLDLCPFCRNDFFDWINKNKEVIPESEK